MVPNQLKYVITTVFGTIALDICSSIPKSIANKLNDKCWIINEEMIHIMTTIKDAQKECRNFNFLSTTKTSLNRMVINTIVMVELFTIGNSLEFNGWIHQYDADQWWNYEQPTFPANMAVGSYNQSLFLLSGEDNGTPSFYQYNINQNTFMDHTSNVISTTITGSAQYFCQINHILYMISPSATFYAFDMKNLIFDGYWNNINIPSDVATNACLATDTLHLFVIGGDNRYTKILNISGLNWINGADMRRSRYDHGCMYHPERQEIYVVGGYSNALSSWERILKPDVFDNGNQYTLYNNLQWPTANIFIVWYSDYILIVGDSSCESGGVNCRSIQMINCIDTTTSTPSGVTYDLQFGSAQTGPAGIKAYDRIWIFPEYSDMTHGTPWRYIYLLSFSPFIIFNLYMTIKYYIFKNSDLIHQQMHLLFQHTIQLMFQALFLREIQQIHQVPIQQTFQQCYRVIHQV